MDDLPNRAKSRYMERPAKVRIEAQSLGGLRVSMPRLLGALPSQAASLQNVSYHAGRTHLEIFTGKLRQSGNSVTRTRSLFYEFNYLILTCVETSVLVVPRILSKYEVEIDRLSSAMTDLMLTTIYLVDRIDFQSS